MSDLQINTYQELKDYLADKNINSVAEYKEFARKINTKENKTVIPVSADLKFKKSGDWISYNDLLGIGEVKTEKVKPVKVEVKEAVTESTKTNEVLSEEDEITIDAELVTKVLNVSDEWTPDELITYIAGKFTKLADYKDWARKENKDKNLHLGKKLPVSPDIYFKDRGHEWVGVNVFLSIGVATKSGKLEAGIKKMENVINDIPESNTDVEKVKIPSYDTVEKSIKEDTYESLGDDSREKETAKAIIRMNSIQFKEIDINSFVKPKDRSGAYANITNVKYAQTTERILTNIVYYSELSAEKRVSKANILVNKDNENLSVLFFNPNGADVEFTEKEIIEIINKILISISIDCSETGKPYDIYSAVKKLEKAKKAVSVFFAVSNYRCFFTKDSIDIFQK